MLKQSILILILTLVTIFFRAEISHVLNALVYVHNAIAGSLHFIFSDDKVGRLIQNVISLLLLPFICGLIVALVFWLVKRVTMPHIMAVVWILWLILLITMLAQTGAPKKATVGTMANHITPGETA